MLTPIITLIVGGSIRAIRIQLIVAALWLAWAIITPIDWLIDRLREAADRTKQTSSEVRGVVGRVHGEGR